jgi:hypothetical protein
MRFVSRTTSSMPSELRIGVSLTPVERIENLLAVAEPCKSGFVALIRRLLCRVVRPYGSFLLEEPQQEAAVRSLEPAFCCHLSMIRSFQPRSRLCPKILKTPLALVVLTLALPSSCCSCCVYAGAEFPRKQGQNGCAGCCVHRPGYERRFYYKLPVVALTGLPMASPETRSSTLRFCCRPAELSLEATGRVLPKPFALTEPVATPCSTR